MFRDFKRAENGNVAIMFAVVVGLLGIGLSVAVDGNKMRAVHTQASAIADAAALAGASASESNPKERLSIVRAYIEANIGQFPEDVEVGEPIISFDDESETVTVTIPTTVNLAFGGLTGQGRRPVGTVRTASYMKNNVDPVTIAFALDVSGSMADPAENGAAKIQVLKQATKSLFDAIEAGSDRPDKLKQALRASMAAYNTDLVSQEPMAYGWDRVEQSVNVLSADGGTNSTSALEKAYDDIKRDRNFRRSYEPSTDLSRLQEYVLFMTDGDNNEPEFDVDSSEICFAMRNDGIKLYTVAFEAPEKGEILLLECASAVGEVDNIDAEECFDDIANANNNGDISKCEKAKKNFYFDANDAKAFNQAFQTIGKQIVRSNVRLN